MEVLKIKAAKALLEVLKSEGVEIIFGVPGGVLLPVYDALYDEPDIKHILTRHEQGAAHAADGYARASGKVGVCMATSGPGATNLVTGLLNAFMDSVPIVAITGQVPTAAIGKDSFQEADTWGITLPATKHNYLLKQPKMLPEVVKEAFYIAKTGRAGPVVIDLPRDISGSEIDDFVVPQAPPALRSYKPTLKGHPLQIKKAAEAINKAQRPILYIGGGVIASGAHQELKELAEKANLPVANTLMGKGAFPETHPLSLGMLGMHGTAYANYAINNSDLIIAIGVRFDDRVTGKLETFAPTAKVIHIDIDPAEIGKNRAADIPIVGDAKQVLKELLKQVNPRPRGAWNLQIEEWHQKYPLKYNQSSREIKPQFVIEELYKATGGNSIIVTGVGQHQMWAAQYYKCKKPRQFISSGGLGTMGFGLPAAIGAQFAKPKELVCLIDGDGSFQMTVQELSVAVIHHLPIKIFIFNNFYLGMVRQWQGIFWQKRYSQVDLSGSPDFVKLAEAYGCAGLRARRPKDVKEVIERALNIKDKPAVVDLRIAREEDVKPMIPAGGSINEMMID